MRLQPFSIKPDVTLWLDLTTGVSVQDNGHETHHSAENMTLGQVLALAKWAHATRVMLTGAPITNEWVLSPLDAESGWEHGRHHLDHATPTGRYTYTAGTSPVAVEVRRAAEWFGEGDYTPRDALAAWQGLTHELGQSGQYSPKALHRSPGATGMDLWLRTHKGEVPEPLDLDLQEEIRSNSTQHRVQIFAPAREQVDQVYLMDGRWMYAALTNELGVGPGTRLTGAQARELFTTDMHARARYYVRWKAPSDWAKAFEFGLLLERPTRTQDKWEAPLAGEGWVEGAELQHAYMFGWSLEFVEGIAWAKGRPLDTWTKRIVRTRDAISDQVYGPKVAKMMRGALRAVLLYTIGSFHSAGSVQTSVTSSGMQRPDGDGWDAPERLENGLYLWRRKSPTTNPRQLATRHPEWSAQIWARARARMIEGPTGTPGKYSGLMHTVKGSVMAIYGDALMLSERPDFADYDDGKQGRLREKGYLDGPIKWPTTETERAELTRRSEHH